MQNECKIFGANVSITVKKVYGIYFIRISKALLVHFMYHVGLG